MAPDEQVIFLYIAGKTYFYPLFPTVRCLLHQYLVLSFNMRLSEIKNR